MRYIDCIILHHSAINSESAQYDAIEAIHKRRWGRGIEYHYVVERSGIVQEGRSLDSVGWHAGDANEHSIGVCLAGDFRYQKPTEAQIRALNAVVSMQQAQFGIPDQRIFLHREVRPTSCPVVDLRALMLDYRKSLLYQPSFSPEAQIKRLTRGIARTTGQVQEMLQRSLQRLLGRL